MTAYDENLSVVVNWVNRINDHWHRCQGELRADKDFWQDCMYDSNTEWQAWADVWPALRVQYQEHAHRYPYLDQDTEDCVRSLHKCQPVVKPHKPNANFAAFRAAMALKDFVNDCAGQPTEKYAKPLVKTTDSKETTYERLFD